MDPLTVVVTISVIVTRIIVATISSIPLIIVTIIAIISIALIPVVAITLVPILIGTCVERGTTIIGGRADQNILARMLQMCHRLVSSIYQSTNESDTAFMYCCHVVQKHMLQRHLLNMFRPPPLPRALDEYPPRPPQYCCCWYCSFDTATFISH